jgi:hypothetical protein
MNDSKFINSQTPIMDPNTNSNMHHYMPPELKVKDSDNIQLIKMPSSREPSKILIQEKKNEVLEEGFHPSFQMP